MNIVSINNQPKKRYYIDQIGTCWAVYEVDADLNADQLDVFTTLDEARDFLRKTRGL